MMQGDNRFKKSLAGRIQGLTIETFQSYNNQLLIFILTSFVFLWILKK